MLKNMKIIALKCIFLTLVSSCGKYEQTYIWDQLSPTAQENIKNRVIKKCVANLATDFSDLSESTVESFENTNLTGNKYKWTSNGSETVYNDVTILKNNSQVFYIFIKVIQSSLNAHGSPITKDRVYKFTTANNNSMVEYMKSILCKNEKTNTFSNPNLEIVLTTPTDAVREDKDITQLTWKYEIATNLPILFSMFNHQFISYEKIDNEVTRNDITTTQKMIENGKQDLENTVFRTSVLSPRTTLEHCDLTTTTWSGNSLDDIIPNCTAAVFTEAMIFGSDNT